MSHDNRFRDTLSWPRIVHIGAWVVIALLAAQWLSINHDKLSNSLESARSAAFASVRDSLRDRPVASQPVSPTISSQEAAILTALADKASKAKLSAEESAMLSAAISQATQPVPAPPPQAKPVPDDAVAGLDSRHYQAFEAIAGPALAFSKVDLLLGAIPVVALMAALWRLRQALLVVGRWGLGSDRAYHRYDQVLQTLAVAVGLKLAIDVGLGLLNLYPSGWPRSNSGAVLLLALGLGLWFGAPRLIRRDPRQLLALIRSDAARTRYSQASYLVAGLAAILLALDLVVGLNGYRADEGLDVVLLVMALVFSLVVPRLIRWRRNPRGRRALEAELEAVRAKADALAQENSQFI